MEEEGEFEPPTRIDGGRDKDVFDAPTVVRTSESEGDATKHDLMLDEEALHKTSLDRQLPEQTSHDTRPAMSPLDRQEKSPRTIVQVSPGPQKAPATTIVRPLAGDPVREEAKTIFLREQLTPAPQPLGPPSEQTTLPPEAASPPRPVIAAIVAAVAGLLLGVVTVVIYASTDDATTPEVETVDPGTIPSQETELDPLSEAPSLAHAADLAIRGRHAEAARAYGALAREQPDRPELAVMARVLRAKARRP